jgi:DNA-binding transcriptional LysR family regulator
LSSADEMLVFVRVVSLGSFTGAAESLSVPKSTVSRQVARLEERLGVRLLHRTTRAVRVTEAGQVFYERAVRIVTDIEEAEELVARNQAVPRGPLRVSAPITFGTMYLPPLVSAFLAAYPDVELSLELSDRKVDLVEDGYDLAVRVGVLDDSSLVARRLGHAHAVVCAAPSYLAVRGVPRTPDDLRDHVALRYAYSGNSGWRFLHGTTPVSGPLICNNGEVLRDAAIAGRGLIYTPRFMVAEALLRGDLVSVLEQYVPQLGGVYAIFPHHRHLSSRVRAFVDLAASHFHVPPWEEAL